MSQGRDPNSAAAYIATCKDEYRTYPGEFDMADEPQQCVDRAQVELKTNSVSHREAAHRALCRALAALELQGVRPYLSLIRRR